MVSMLTRGARFSPLTRHTLLYLPPLSCIYLRYYTMYLSHSYLSLSACFRSKVVTTAFEPEDSIRVHAAAKSLALPVPYIGLCLTETGKLSRVLNERFTPVTHEKLPFVAAPGQMSSKEIMRHRADLGLCPPRSFFLLGHPISASPSPDMHNAGFRSSGLPHEYFLCEGEDPAVLAEALSRPDFGGASVTIPHKQNILPLLDEASEAAETIGAVNTVIVGTDPETGARRLRGDNTDWLGILRPVKARLDASGWEQGRGGVALVVGAGGAAMGALFAMQRLGLEVVVYNRTPSKAEELAGRFGGASVSTLDAETLQKACGVAAVDVVVSTIPAASEFTLPDYLLESKVGRHCTGPTERRFGVVLPPLYITILLASRSSVMTTAFTCFTGSHSRATFFLPTIHLAVTAYRFVPLFLAVQNGTMLTMFTCFHLRLIHLNWCLDQTITLFFPAGYPAGCIRRSVQAGTYVALGPGEGGALPVRAGSRYACRAGVRTVSALDTTEGPERGDGRGGFRQS